MALRISAAARHVLIRGLIAPTVCDVHTATSVVGPIDVRVTDIPRHLNVLPLLDCELSLIVECRLADALVVAASNSGWINGLHIVPLPVRANPGRLVFRFGTARRAGPNQCFRSRERTNMYWKTV